MSTTTHRTTGQVYPVDTECYVHTHTAIHFELYMLACILYIIVIVTSGREVVVRNATRARNWSPVQHRL